MTEYSEDTYLLCRAVLSASWQSLMNAFDNKDNEWEANRHFAQADKLEQKFKSQFGHHPLTWIELYEKSRIHSD